MFLRAPPCRPFLAETTSCGTARRGECWAAFVDLMKQKFLGGEDQEVDYASIDAGADPALDDDLAVEATRDIEERYFAED